jgi:hypothetical protein
VGGPLPLLAAGKLADRDEGEGPERRRRRARRESGGQSVPRKKERKKANGLVVQW